MTFVVRLADFAATFPEDKDEAKESALSAVFRHSRRRRQSLTESICTMMVKYIPEKMLSKSMQF
jgi:hypothetical protein